MKLLATFLGLLIVGVFSDEVIDYSGVKSRVILENNYPWQPPFVAGGGVQGVDSSEHGVTPGRRTTSCLCGTANRGGGRIVGGKVHSRHKYNWIVGIASTQAPRNPFCGGTIISPWHVLTAAHCTMDSRSLVIIAGGYDRSGGEQVTIIAVRQIYDHPQFNRQVLHNDISILFLVSPIPQSLHIGIICLPSRPGASLVGHVLKIIGWGAEQFRGQMTRLPKEVYIHVMDLTSCRRVWQQLHTAGNQLCTLTPGGSACQGDSGGPVVWHNPETNTYELAGAVSFGDSCNSNKPSIQTAVHSFLSWIHSIIQMTVPGQQTCQQV
uniref:Venom S1 protease 24 n=1 Tax=Oncocephalus sp. TaxID=2944721 RepID=A0AB38ZEM3_9HEMI